MVRNMSNSSELSIAGREEMAAGVPLPMHGHAVRGAAGKPVVDREEQARGGDSAKAPGALIARIRAVLRGRSNEAIAAWAGVSAESIRRYLAGDPPPARFLVAMCEHEDISGDWLLTGRGHPRISQQSSAALRECELADVLGEVGRRLDSVLQGNGGAVGEGSSGVSFFRHA
jgi:hypothetical protein